MMENNPDYVSFLEGLNPVDKAQLLHGCWNVRTSGVSYFNRENLVKLPRVPSDAIWARGWDLAYQDVNTLNKDPDFTACTKMGKTRDGRYVIVGSHHPQNKDSHVEHYGRFREKSGERDRRIALQGQYDGKECVIVLPKDPAAGEIAFQETSKRLLEKGLRVKKDPVPSNKDKLSRFIPFSDAVEAGLVYIVESTFDKASLEAFYKELERFIGERSGRAITKKDD